MENFIRNVTLSLIVLLILGALTLTLASHNAGQIRDLKNEIEVLKNERAFEKTEFNLQWERGSFDGLIKVHGKHSRDGWHTSESYRDKLHKKRVGKPAKGFKKRSGPPKSYKRNCCYYCCKCYSKCWKRRGHGKCSRCFSVNPKLRCSSGSLRGA